MSTKGRQNPEAIAIHGDPLPVCRFPFCTVPFVNCHLLFIMSINYDYFSKQSEKFFNNILKFLGTVKICFFFLYYLSFIMILA